MKRRERRERQPKAAGLVALTVAASLVALPARAAPGSAATQTDDIDDADDLEAEAGSDTDEGAGAGGPGGVYDEPVDYGWDGSKDPQPPDSGPVVDIEVYNSLRPVFLVREDGESTEVCEAPCGRRIGDPSGQFVLQGPGRRTSKPFSLGAEDSLHLDVRGGNPKHRSLGIALFPIAGVAAIILVVVPFRVNMPIGAGVAMWSTAGLVALGGVAGGMTLLRFSTTQVAVGPS
ncbi:hypothetical protein G6O69_28070 [Pseudenhygromyxa sp. WMMC2535]|uniref:hypothetical protein n=1 Tax=Pseudenhygromyxa sp. WMMC2535 TaxID=2712867 RepID=UPI0015546FF7|nr:hypothetical protein [Pseudenhygromyxa sp. WMMC2535]NVB41723.1 hypothetical protein [Pseudenhygromyxa sp. WMMC2535]